MWRLSGNQRLLLGNSRDLGELGRLVRSRLSNRDGLRGRSDRELGTLGRGDGNLFGGSRSSGRGRAATDHVLDLASVVTGVLLAKSSKLISLLLSGVADLSSLSVDDFGGVLEVLIDELLVGSVDEGNKESNGGAKDGKTPVGNKLDKEVGDEGRKTGLGQCQLRPQRGLARGCQSYNSGDANVFGKENALTLDDEKVDELVNVANNAVNGVAVDGVVAARTELRSNTIVQDKLASNLGTDGNSESHP